VKNADSEKKKPAEKRSKKSQLGALGTLTGKVAPQYEHVRFAESGVGSRFSTIVFFNRELKESTEVVYRN
jgi:hypothetical protein